MARSLRSFAPPALVGLAFAALLRAAAPVPAAPARYVTDHAGVFDAARARALNEKLAAYDRATSNQVVVDVETKIPQGTTLEEYAHAAFRQWGVGRKGKNNGVLLLVFLDDRKMRIEVGYGLEGAIPDAAAHRITDETIKPRFRKGDYAGGVAAGVDAILDAASGEHNRGSGRTEAEGRLAPSRLLAALPGGAKNLLMVLFLGMLLPVLLLFYILRRARRGGWTSWARPTSRGGSGRASSSSYSDSSSSFWPSSSSDSSSSSSSDFSGGGGDSGGGGSSDSW